MTRTRVSAELCKQIVKSAYYQISRHHTYTLTVQYRNTHLHEVSGAVAQNIQRDLWAAFTAKYLPSLLDQILDLPPHGARPYGAEDYSLQNIYHTTLKFTDIAYLAKFMPSSRTIAEGRS